MPSSKIIKTDSRESSSIEEFSYRPISASSERSMSAPVIGSFVPMGSYEEREALGAVIEISEDELLQRTTDAFNAGLKDGKDLAERGLVNVFKSLRGASEAIHSLRDKVLRESEDELIDLVMMVARKVIIREVSQERSILAEVVKNAVAGLSVREEVIVRINPDDYTLVTTDHDALLHEELVNERFLLKSDPTVATGFCKVETEMGTIDAGLDAQLEEIYRHLLEQRAAAVAAVVTSE
ncbi:MAG TPA: hypothetical protein HPP76_09620 [Desulfuromonadales bacterium]|nr:hypothetical protein [Desulfuromonadales bacterium]